MTWRGSTDIKDRIFGALVYLMPLYSGMIFGRDLLSQFPIVADLLGLLLTPILLIYRVLPLGGFLLFFILFLAVVRNERVPHFIRFNTMQAILVDIVLSLLSMLFFRILAGALPALIATTIFNSIFTVVLAVCLYSMVQSAMGRYPEIPAISEAVYTQVP